MLRDDPLEICNKAIATKPWVSFVGQDGSCYIMGRRSGEGHEAHAQAREGAPRHMQAMREN
jgi:hypothetical protein